MNIIDLKGIGPKTAALFNRLSIYDTHDLLRYYPRDYEVYEKPVLVSELTTDHRGCKIAIEGVVSAKPVIYRAGKFNVTTVLLKDIEGHGIKCKWYNMPYIGKRLVPSARFILRGHLSSSNMDFTLEQPVIYSPKEYDTLLFSMQPIYPLTKGLSRTLVQKAVKQALSQEKNKGHEENNNYDKDWLPDEILNKYDLMDTGASIESIHFPSCEKERNEAARRIAFDEFFLFALAVMRRKKDTQAIHSFFLISNHEKVDRLIEGLDYELTDAQLRAWSDIKKDLSGGFVMNRLVQGDVGSGKTIVAVMSLFLCALNGFQGALMAPTEVLATQEYKELSMLADRHLPDLKIELLTGSLSANEKKRIYQELKDGKIDILAGTHALIQEGVEFSRLALVITDEQHRFGVGQRKALRDKTGGEKVPHVLVMSATPIPRTLAWILYGDLDISVIDELPKGRRPIKNAVVDTSYRPNAYRFIKNKVKEGRQAYVICPMVEESEGLDAENVIDYSKELQKELGDDVRVAMLHGRMKPEKKQEVMSKFAAGDIDVLVSTTVIEVGVNVPNSTVMMIENAERFGLSQLHQLRGRVGRGEEESYCLFVSDATTSDAKERLDIISSTNDGFEIASKDLEIRGPGDFFGMRQSGELKFKIADPAADTKLMRNAADEAKRILQEDPQLSEEKHKGIRRQLDRFAGKIYD